MNFAQRVTGRGRGALAASLFGIGALHAPGMADGTLDHDSYRNEIGAYLIYWDYTKSGVETDHIVNDSGSSFTDALDGHWLEDGFEGVSHSSDVSTFLPNAEPRLGGSFSAIAIDFDASTTITQAAPLNHYWEYTDGWEENVVYFSIDAETEWSWEADVKGKSSGAAKNAYGRYRFFLKRTDASEFVALDYLTSLNGVGDYDQHIFLSGTIPPGAYQVYFTSQASVANQQSTGGPGAATASISDGLFCLGGCPPTCYADFNGDGKLDLFDFLAFVNAFNSQETSANCVDDKTFDLFDFLCFVNAFNQGC